MVFHEYWIREDLFRRTIRLEFSSVEDENSLADLEHKIQIVRGNNLSSRKLPQDLQ